MAQTRRVMAHVGSSLLALAMLVAGLKALTVWPIAGVLLTLAGLALSLFSVASLCGTDYAVGNREGGRGGNPDRGDVLDSYQALAIEDGDPTRGSEWLRGTYEKKGAFENE